VALQDLGRQEALELLQGVFGPELQAPAGVFDELNVERFLSPNVAIIAGDEPPRTVPAPSVSEDLIVGAEEEPSPPASEKDQFRAEAKAEGNEVNPEARETGEGFAQVAGASLLDSTVPLRTEAPTGQLEAVDLSLEHSDGQLQPVAALVEVGLPQQLGEGIELPGPGVQIELAGAPEGRAPSTIESSVAFYPNVAQDTDFAVAPSPTGVETLTQIRSVESPRSQTFNLGLPPGATLQSDEGGAAVVHGEETLVSIAPPTAVDATGAEVPVSFETRGSSLTVTITPDESTQFPVLLDPLFQTYEWMNPNTKYWQDGICNSSFEAHVFNQCNNREEWGISGEAGGGAICRISNQFWGEAPNTVPQGTPGLFVKSCGAQAPGGWGGWIYTVPRYFTDQEKYGSMPTSYIGHLTLSNVLWQANSSNASPYLFNGIWDPVKKEWVSLYSHTGATGHGLGDMSYQYQFPNENPQTHQPNTNAKIAQVSIASTESAAQGNTDVYVGNASVELGDKEAPQPPLVTGQSGWANQTPAPVTFTASDSGLGVFAMTASTEQLGENGQPLHTWSASYGCKGVGDAACPRIWESKEAGHPALNYEPTLLPTGISYLSVVAEDPIGNKSAPAYAQVKVDHTPPVVALGGSVTEQAMLGTKRPNYNVKVNATDGTAEKPQSGVASVFIEMDGAVVAKSEPGCATKNCSLSLEWTLESSKYSAGQHTVKVRAKDGVNLETTKTISVTLNPSPPALALSGSITEQASLGTSRPRYALKLNASAEAGYEGLPVPAPGYTSSFGSAGSGSGQFSHPGDVAIDPSGNLWVIDENNNRIQKFNENGEFLAQYGSLGSGNGQFSRPTAIAIDAKGNILVTDAGNRRIQKLSPSGEFLSKFGSAGSGNGQFAGGGPEGIAIDSKGNIYISDTYGGRVEKFNEVGEFIKAIGSLGSAPGQLVEPTGIDIGPGGNLWVADWANNRVEVYGEAGEYVRQFGSAGTGNSQFQRPDALAIGPKGEVWVGDQNNGRIQQFNQSGEFVAKFGSPGSGTGQFSFGYPMGIAANSKGTLWITDTGNNRVQRWQVPGYLPTYSSAFGSAGASNGQFSHPAGVAIDAKGNAWVVDRDNRRVEKFNEAGEYLSSFGSYGSGNGQFGEPIDVAIDAKGNLLVTDARFNRVEKFNEKGEYLSQFGSAGTGNGKFSYPQAIAVAPNGTIWVADSENARLQAFNEKGEFLRTVGSFGFAAGKFIFPVGIAADPDGNIWASDAYGGWVSVFTESGAFVRRFSGGSGAIDIDRWGHAWVVNNGYGRVQEYDLAGQYVAQFGSGGSGSGQFSFSEPTGIASDASGRLLISDPGNNRVQKWTQQPPYSEISTELTVDGNRVDSRTAGCAVEHCALQREWMFNSPAYSVGPHTVIAKASDGFGNTTTKSLTIDVQRDTTKPSLEASGELINAPEGWVEQESYGLSASASDGGYGTTSLAFKIDGEQVAAVSQGCSDGGCEESLTKSINMSPYSGGAHGAELIATDGAGNAAIKKWTINVDPEGHISDAEVIDTVEAGEATGLPDVLRSGEEGAGVGGPVTLSGNGEALEAVGAWVPTEIAKDPSHGVKMQILEGGAFNGPSEETPSLVPIAIEPTHEGELANEVTLGPDAATAVAANTTAGQVDTVVRPTYDGSLTFQIIRDPASPEAFSWTVALEGGQEMTRLTSGAIQVYYPGGHPAFAILAEPAHDAIGASVPTELSVSEGNVLTLTVKHRNSSFVYPIVAGTGWEGGFTTSQVTGPKDQQELREEWEREQQEKQELLEAEWEEAAGGGSTLELAKELEPGKWGLSETGSDSVGPPEIDLAASTSGAQVSGVWVPARSVASRRFSRRDCYIFPVQEPAFPLNPNEHGECAITSNVMVRGHVYGYFHYEIPKHLVWWNNGREGEIGCNVDRDNPNWHLYPKECKFSGENQQTTHIVARNFWRTQTNLPLSGNVVICQKNHVDLYPNGNISKNWPDYYHDPVTYPGAGKPCPWAE
jgi:sugar lactone lactonase YvrE